MQLRSKTLLVFSLLVVAALVLHCTEKYPPAPAGEAPQLAAESGCVNCHLDKELLKQVADPVEHPTESGEG